MKSHSFLFSFITRLVVVFAPLLLCDRAAAQSEADSIGSILLRPIEVVARPGWLKEEAFIGEYKRPEWTSKRRFGATRGYIQQDPWQVSVEQWWRSRSYRNQGKKLQSRFIEEIEIGLPYRMQLDIYGDWGHENGKTIAEDLAFELRWALADWGVIPLNPTLYGEYKLSDGNYDSDIFEFKLLFCDDFTPRLHWALNFSYEREIARARNNEFAISQGVSYTLIDQKLSVGLEMVYKYENEEGGRANGSRKFNIGPSVQWRPTENSWVNFVCMAGCSAPSPATEAYIIFGYNFGRVANGPSISRPVSAPR